MNDADSLKSHHNTFYKSFQNHIYSMQHNVNLTLAFFIYIFVNLLVCQILLFNLMNERTYRFITISHAHSSWGIKAHEPITLINKQRYIRVDLGLYITSIQRKSFVLRLFVRYFVLIAHYLSSRFLNTNPLFRLQLDIYVIFFFYIHHSFVNL